MPTGLSVTRSGRPIRPCSPAKCGPLPCGFSALGRRSPASRSQPRVTPWQTSPAEPIGSGCGRESECVLQQGGSAGIIGRRLEQHIDDLPRGRVGVRPAPLRSALLVRRREALLALALTTDPPQQDGGAFYGIAVPLRDTDDDGLFSPGLQNDVGQRGFDLKGFGTRRPSGRDRDTYDLGLRSRERMLSEVGASKRSPLDGQGRRQVVTILQDTILEALRESIWQQDGFFQRQTQQLLPTSGTVEIGEDPQHVVSGLLEVGAA